MATTYYEPVIKYVRGRSRSEAGYLGPEEKSAPTEARIRVVQLTKIREKYRKINMNGVLDLLFSNGRPPKAIDDKVGSAEEPAD